MKVKTLIIATFALLAAVSCFGQNKKYKSIYDITVKDIKGNDVSLADYKGKVLLIVNVASKCGLTPQYEGLEALYLKYKDQGLEILAFPCNQFLEQEPGTNEEIQNFCSLTYNVTFPLFDKVDVRFTKKRVPVSTKAMPSSGTSASFWFPKTARPSCASNRWCHRRIWRRQFNGCWESDCRLQSPTSSR